MRPCRVDLGPAVTLSNTQPVFSTSPAENQSNGAVEVHQNRRRIHCKVCRVEFSSKEDKKKHQEDVHSLIMDRRRLTKKPQRVEHQIKHGLRKCEFCIKTSRTYPTGRMLEHLRKFHEGETFVRCSYLLCSTFFRSEEEKQKHEELIHAGANKTKCIFCNLFFPNSTMTSHLKYSHKSQYPNAFKCTFPCSTYFLTELERDRHIDSVHKKLKLRQEVECIYCNKLCTDKILLRNHIRICHSDVKIRCKMQQCNQFFLTQTQSDAHYNEVHRKREEKKKLRCSECDFRSNKLSNVKKHAIRNHKSKDIPCPNVKCSKLFSSAYALTDHLRYSHAELKTCQHCKMKLVEFKYHQMQAKCKKCQRLLPCVRKAQQHYKVCH